MHSFFTMYSRTLKYNLDYQARTVESWKVSVALDPQDPAAHNNLGNAYSREQKYADAICEYEIAIRLSPSLSAVHYNLAVVYDLIGRSDDAITEYRTSLLLDPYVIFEHNVNSDCLEKGWYSSVMKEHINTLQDKPSAYVYYVLSLAFQEQGRHQEAEEFYSKYIDLTYNDLIEAANNTE